MPSRPNPVPYGKYQFALHPTLSVRSNPTFYTSCHTVYRRLRLFDRRTRRYSPLRTTFPRDAPGICHSRWLPTHRRRRSGPNDTPQTRSPPCDDASSSLSPGLCRDALVATRRSTRRDEFPITDAVRLGCGSDIRLTRRPAGRGELFKEEVAVWMTLRVLSRPISLPIARLQRNHSNGLVLGCISIPETLSLARQLLCGHCHRLCVCLDIPCAISTSIHSCG